jgi:hypothetical protein
MFSSRPIGDIVTERLDNRSQGGDPLVDEDDAGKPAVGHWHKNGPEMLEKPDRSAAGGPTDREIFLSTILSQSLMSVIIA